MTAVRRRLGASAVVIAAAAAIVGLPVGGQEAGLIVTTVFGNAARSPFGDSDPIATIGTDLFVYQGNGVVQKRAPSGEVTTVAGVAHSEGSVDGVGSAARLTGGPGMAVSPAGALYIAERAHTIRRVETNGTVTTLAGAADSPGAADGVGTAARFRSPHGLAVDAAGVIYIADSDNHTIRRIALDGTVTTVAGIAGVSGHVDAVGSAARFSYPIDIVVDDAGTLWVADRDNHVIRRIATDGTVTTAAGLAGQSGYRNGAGSVARFTSPRKLKLFDGTLYVIEVGRRIRRLAPATGQVTEAFPFDSIPSDLARLPDGSMWLIQRHFSTAGALVLIATNGWPRTVLFERIYYSHAALHHVDTPRDLATRDGFVYVAEGDGVWRADMSTMFYAQRWERNSNVAGDWTGAFGVTVAAPTLLAYTGGCGVASEGVKGDGYDLAAGHTHDNRFGNAPCGFVDGTNNTELFRDPRGLTVDPAGLAHVVDSGNHAIRRIATNPSGSIFTRHTTTTLAGSGTAGSADGAGAAAGFNAPTDITQDSAGMLYVTDTANHTIRRIDTNGVVTTLAGLAGNAGATNATGAFARFNQPRGITFDLDGTLLVADTGNHAIRRVTTAGVVTTVAGLPGTSGSADGSATDARFLSPQGVAVDRAGIIYVADTGNHLIRQLSSAAPAAPVITQQPASVAADEGQVVVLSVVASGSPEPTYRWDYSDDDGLTWSTGLYAREYRLGAVTAALHNRVYRVAVANTSGMVMSETVRLTVDAIFALPPEVNLRATRHGALGPIVSQSRPVEVRLTMRSNVPVQWTATANQPWVTIVGGSGTGAGRITISANATELQSGSHAAVVTVAAPGAGLTKAIPVWLFINSTGTSDPPFGWLDTPANGSQGLSGAIVVSGWALDDIGVDRVEIWRDLAPGESTQPYVGPGPGNGKVFIAHGMFVAGTRPDVETVYGFGRPDGHRSGWGYMLLTYGLPDRGNGTVTLHAFAYDAEGQHTALGSKTINVNNNAATKPFGTIDYPASGEVVSGSYTNNGWVLTPNVNGSPDCTITNVQMTIDSAPPYFPVTYGTSRPDVSSAFPGLSNTAAPGAQITFDTTAYSNGLHAIGWVAYDSCGRGEGIGSRFIRIENSAGRAAAPRPTRDLRSLGLDAAMYPAQTMRLEVLERGELTLPSIAGATWTGHELVLGEARRLPIGSTLDGANGRFYWQPAPGFFGTFDLRFVAHVNGAAVAQVPVRVIVGPGMRLAIDTPSSHEQVPAVFTIAGWAADLAASDGTGIDAVHVWAYPLEGGDPIFAGHAGLGAPRPDVAEVHGAQFASSGYYLTVGHLLRGWYDLVVYPHSSVDGEFRGARVVRVLVR